MASLSPENAGAEFQFERPEWTLFRSVNTLPQKASVPLSRQNKAMGERIQLPVSSPLMVHQRHHTPLIGQPAMIKAVPWRVPVPPA